VADTEAVAADAMRDLHQGAAIALGTLARVAGTVALEDVARTAGQETGDVAHDHQWVETAPGRETGAVIRDKYIVTNEKRREREVWLKCE